jgi:hypothetical protein
MDMNQQLANKVFVDIYSERKKLLIFLSTNCEIVILFTCADVFNFRFSGLFSVEGKTSIFNLLPQFFPLLFSSLNLIFCSLVHQS